eukprot:1177539-Prorocentrum_minimum.AAC.2
MLPVPFDTLWSEFHIPDPPPPLSGGFPRFPKGKGKSKRQNGSRRERTYNVKRQTSVGSRLPNV